MAMSARLAEIYDQIPESTCVDGCGKCCGPVFPSLAEIRNVKDWCAVHHVEYQDFMKIGEDGMCPYLDSNERCIIYPVRPFLCRILGASTELTCPLEKCQVKRMLNRRQSDILYKAIYLRGKEKPRTEKHARMIRKVLDRI